jgi:hypothetical protein
VVVAFGTATTPRLGLRCGMPCHRMLTELSISLYLCHYLFKNELIDHKYFQTNVVLAILVMSEVLKFKFSIQIKRVQTNK